MGFADGPGSTFSLFSPAGSSVLSLGLEACSAVSSVPSEGPVPHLSFSEEVDVRSINRRTPKSPAYEELVEVVTRAVIRLTIDWKAETRATSDSGPAIFPRQLFYVLKVYVAAIAAYHTPFDGVSLKRDLLVSHLAYLSAHKVFSVGTESLNICYSTRFKMTVIY